MSKFSDVYDALRVRLTALFPNKLEIPYPYTLGNNKEQFLADGYGLKAGAGSTSELSNDYTHTIVRNFSVVLSQETYGLDAYDPNKMVVATKALLDDMYLVKNDFLSLTKVSPMFSGEDIVYDGDSGIEEVLEDNSRYISIEISFSFELTQEINQ